MLSASSEPADVDRIRLVAWTPVDRWACAHVTVNAVNPGPAWTPGTAQLTPQAVPFWRPLWLIVRFFQRRVSPQKAAEAPTWLALDPAVASISGQYFEKKKEAKLPPRATDVQEQQRVLYAASELLAVA